MEGPSIDIGNCVVICGPELEPFMCSRFSCEDGVVREITKEAPVIGLPAEVPIVVPGLINGHTHMGDSFLPDGSTGMTLEEGFFRPNGYKYRQLAKIDQKEHVAAISDSLRYMAATGTVAHYDFREQGPEGSRRLREASVNTGVDSVILGQINEIPFSEKQLLDNMDYLEPDAMDQYREILQIADGFSESTINDLTDAAWKWLREEAGKAGKMRAIHCLENAGYRERSESITGEGDLERALEVYDPHLIVHLTVANAEEIRMLAESGAVAVLNPRANAALGLPLPPIRELQEAGVPLMLGTDNGLLNSPNMLAELDFTYKVAKSQYGNAVDPDPREILKMATSNVRHLKGSRQSGFLDTGQPASFFVVDGSKDHLRRSRHLTATLCTRVTPADILATFRKGQCLHGQVPSAL